jgi:hypothetical protein
MGARQNSPGRLDNVVAVEVDEIGPGMIQYNNADNSSADARRIPVA